ncbi:DUF5666 domain-containing protein [Inquilinus sp. NPDC058860]|uniref:DUF5666 domain-containing protein n=1 Tax=Inquilinus sp. NPDC058860 TaxID=3346652 RepID=UPI00367D258D
MSRMRLLALALLAACSSAGSGDRAVAPAATGGPTAGTAGTTEAVADRGIGGTGISPTGPVEDRGMGGTGIVGVITGFGSIWVNGIEVEFDPATPVRIDGAAARSGDLRVGQVAVITATGSGSRLGARSIAVRHEVSGPVEAVESNGTALRVAGQRVSADGPVWGDGVPQVDDWVAVSGLPGPDGAIVATRIDRRQPGRVIVHGPLAGTAEAPRIGTLALRPGSRLGAGVGQEVMVTGHYADGVLVPDGVSRDGLAADPAGWFGRSVSRLVIESYASATPGGLRWGRGLNATAAGPIGALGAQPQRTILELQRQPGGGLEAVGLRSTIGRTGNIPEAPRTGGDRPGGFGPGGAQGFPGGRERSEMAPPAPGREEPRGGPGGIGGGSRPMQGPSEGCGAGGPGDLCGPTGMPGRGHRGRPPGG